MLMAKKELFSFFEQTIFWNSISDDLITGAEESMAIIRCDAI
jgi:hypothetical protein